MSDEKLLGMLQNPMDLMKTTTANPGKLEAEQKRLAVAIGESGLGNMRRDGTIWALSVICNPERASVAGAGRFRIAKGFRPAAVDEDSIKHRQLALCRKLKCCRSFPTGLFKQV